MFATMVCLGSQKTNIFVLILLITTVKQLSCECVRSYMLICDTIEDFKKENDGTWFDVTIKSKKLESSKMVNLELRDFRRVTNVIIVGQIYKIPPVICEYDTDLKFLSLYGNRLKKLNGNIFRNPHLNLWKLSLVKNQIETIESEAFATSQVRAIDLSDNLLEVIVRNTFTRKKAYSSIEFIIIQNNKLAVIEAHSFPVSLRVLKLDNNDLRFFQNGVIDDLVNLQGLFLSHNKFYLFPNIKNLTNLRVLDISHNRIQTIDRRLFENLERLLSLDLSHNRLKQADFLEPLLLKNTYLSAYLAFNHLSELQLGIDKNISLHDKSLMLFGNPWSCHKWISIKKYLNEIGVKQTECDLAYFESGRYPFCFLFHGVPLVFPNSTGRKSYIHVESLEISEEEMENFAKAVEPALVDCKLTSFRSQFLLNDIFSLFCTTPPLTTIPLD